MEKCQLAITANGRTIYELAHLNIPSLVFSHHVRETTHLFAHENNGFFPMGLYDESSSQNLIRLMLKLISDNNFRQEAFLKIEKTHLLQEASSTIQLQKVSKEIPFALACSGLREVGVIPG